MRNKVEIRAFAVEQVVKMRCMSDCTIEDVVDQAKLIETYVVGDAQLSEDGNEMSELMGLVADMKDVLKHQLEKTHKFPSYEEAMSDEVDEETRKKNLALSWNIAKKVRESEARREALEYMNESTERFMRLINDDNNEVGAILPS